MTEKKKIHTGTYILGNQEENSSFGGVFGILKVPKYTHEIGFLSTTISRTSKKNLMMQFFTL